MAIKYMDINPSVVPSAQKTPKTIQATVTAISKANGAVVTAANDFSDGDIAVVTGVAGMTEINFRAGTVASSSATGFTLTEIDSTLFTTYTSGGIARKIQTVTNHVRLLFEDTKDRSELVAAAQVAKEALIERKSEV